MIQVKKEGKCETFLPVNNNVMPSNELPPNESEGRNHKEEYRCI